MLTTRTPNRVLLVAVAVGLLSGCFEDDNPPGSLIVPFKLGKNLDCDEFNVDRVVGKLDHHDDGDDEDDEDDEVYSENVRCEAEKLEFDSIPEGTYRLRLFGYDGEYAVMDNLDSEDLSVNIIADETVLAERAVTLTPSPANLQLRWSFGFGSCKSAGIGSFLINVWRADGSAQLLEYEMDCDKVGEGEAYYREVPDSKRRLAGDVVGEVLVQPLDESGTEVGDPLEFTFQSPGPGRDIKLSFECQADSEGFDDEDYCDSCSSKKKPKQELCTCSGKPD
jgi:hypothetical protein